MITKEELDAMVKEEIERLGVGRQEFKRKCQELDELGEIRHLLEKASNSLDSFQYRYKLMFSLDDDAETKDWFFKQRKDMELGLSIISDYITTAHKKLHLIEKEKTAK